MHRMVELDNGPEVMGDLPAIKDVANYGVSR
jgi:hypothetical protein